MSVTKPSISTQELEIHRNVIPLPQNEITVLQVLIFMLSLSYSKIPVEPSTVILRFPSISMYGIVPISNIGEGILSFFSVFRLFFGKKISPVFISHLFLCNRRHIY